LDAISFYSWFFEGSCVGNAWDSSIDFFGVPLASKSPLVAFILEKFLWSRRCFWRNFFFLALAVLRGKSWVYGVSACFFIVWWVVSLVFVCQIRMPSLAFFTFSLGLFALWELGWLRWQFKCSFMDPHWKWYQGRPRRIPELKCELRAGKDQVWECYVCRIDRGGIFVFQVSEQPIAQWMLTQKRLELLVRFKKFSLALEGVPTQVLSQNQGLGIRFFELSVDRKKHLGDFLAMLEGVGYV